MYKYLKSIKQSADYSAMETGDHFKNGASLKSLTSRGNIFNRSSMGRRLFIVLVAVMAIGGYCKAQDLKPKECENGKYGYVDKTGKMVVPCKYDDAVD
jgi:hypothetical protein